MKTPRVRLLLAVMLLVACSGLAAALDRWFIGWPGNRAGHFNPLLVALGDGQRLFAGHFYRKADVYFHSGMYPSIFDNNESFRTAHIGADAGAAGSKNTGDEAAYLGQPRDFIDRFSRNFFPARHTHLDHGGAAGEHDDPGEVREILPWLKLAQELDPEEPLTYTVTAYWLRSRLNKSREAEVLLREGLRHLPDHPALQFELGRIYYENDRDPARARHLWDHAVQSWQRIEASKPDPDRFVLEQLLAHLAKLEEDQGQVDLAIGYWEQVRRLMPEREGIQARIDELRQQPSAAPHSP